jgi:ABC-type antimicrobial peptide transport system permease subunit
MIRNYFKIAWRNIKNNKLHSSINIVGLAVAFSVSILLFLTAYSQLIYDSFHKDKSQLFKMSLYSNSIQEMNINSQFPLPLMSTLKMDIPDIETAVRVHRNLKENITYKGKNIERLITRTDPEFFEIFNFPIIIGNKTTALSGIHDIALSESTAKAIFGEIDPIGKEIKIGKIGAEKLFIVSALIKDSPKNSSIRFDAVARIESLNNYDADLNNWDANYSNIFIRISKNSSKQIIENKLVSTVEKYYPERLAQLKTEHTETLETNELLSFNLTNIKDIHFSGERSTPLLLIYAIMALGVFILLIACFNFVNLNMAHSFKRSRELGVRKTLGALKGQLFIQLWGEAFILYFIGFIFGIGLAAILIPYFNAQFDVGIQISTLFQSTFLAIMLGVFLLVTLIAGGYPALKMANFKLVEVLKGRGATKKPGVLQNSLIVSQFAISSLLICISFIASQQLDYLRQKPIGFEKSQVISIPVGYMSDGRKVLSRMQNELENDPNIVSVTGVGANLGRGRDRTTSRSTIDFEYNQHQISSDWFLADFDFLKTLQIPIIKGRDFNRNYATDTINAVIVSESFVKAMGESDPIGKYFGGEENKAGHQIIGVIPNFHLHAPSSKTLPIAIHLSSTEAINYIFIKTQSDDPYVTMEQLSVAWKRSTSNAVFKASFLNENLQAWYEGESIMATIFGLAAGIAIFLSCLGLFAISLMVIELRTKEIGIRKVMGASVSRIVSMITFYFLRLIAISLLIALPIAWFTMQSWIENYVYRIEINLLTFMWVGLLVTAVALITISFHAIKAANTNPVNSLKIE